MRGSTTRRGIEYLGNAIPRLPLAQCVRADCECDYHPVGSEKLRSLYVGKPLPPSWRQLARLNLEE